MCSSVPATVAVAGRCRPKDGIFLCFCNVLEISLLYLCYPVSVSSNLCF
ncbi:hypothetical protein SAMN04487825_10265 [Prevotella sp. kh1p2]|nr:hypothetical protein SAMN04487825_10265 [Prevotella sp. kh1p2]SNU10287.1 hypothetical protein SAMN06298210_10249 [Prevotellaceae bacterium KH2P17]